MKRKLGRVLLVVTLIAITIPAQALAQNRSEYGGFIRRDKNGVRVGENTRITLFDGPGIVNYKYKEPWMPGPGGAATVIGIGAGAGAATGGLIRGKKGAIVGAIIGGGAATGLWLYKNRWHTKRIF
jgi:hypothetical protein